MNATNTGPNLRIATLRRTTACAWALTALAALFAVSACSAQRPVVEAVTCDVCEADGPCTVGSCDPATGKCRFEPAIDAACDDGDACTTNDVCKAGACAAGAALSCDDGQLCTDDSCAAASGCVHANNALPCDDGDVCTDPDSCIAGSCKAGASRVCEDNDPCTTDACDAVAGCTHAARSGPCDDGNACTKSDSCTGGVCAGSTTLNCDDGNACTKDACDFEDGCKITEANGAACDDGDSCTAADACDGGKCVAGAAKTCDDGDPCTVGESCVKGGCDAGKAADCEDGDFCTTDSCNSFVGCENLGATGNKCDDGTACTLKDTCAFGACKGTPLICDDGNACTDDSCSPVTGCVATANTNLCDDGSECTAVDQCLNGSCNAGAPINCNLCGNGALDGPSANAPAACAKNEGAAVVQTLEQLATWQIKSNRPLTIDGLLKIGGADLDIDTPCDVKITENGGISGAGGVFLAANNVQIQGDLSASGTVIVRATKTLNISDSASVTGGLKSLALEAKLVQVATDLTIGSSLCVEAGTAELGTIKPVGTDQLSGKGDIDITVSEALVWNATAAASGNVKISSGGDVTLGAAGSFDGSWSLLVKAAGSVTCNEKLGKVDSVGVTAGKDIAWKAGCDATSSGGISLAAGAKMTMDGSAAHGGHWIVTAAVLSLGKGSQITGAGAVDMLASGSDKAKFDGAVTDAITVGIKMTNGAIGENAVFSANKQVVVIANDALEVNGSFTKNGSVWLQGKTLSVPKKPAFVGNTTCGMQGLVDGDAESLGCKTVAP